MRTAKINANHAYHMGALQGHFDAWQAGWRTTVERLGAGGATVVVSEIVPTLDERVPACLIEHGAHTTRCDFRVDADPDVVAPNVAIAALAADPAGGARVVVVDPTPIACPDGLCPALHDGVVVHRDDNHLSATFVRDHADDLGALLTAAGITAFT